LARPIEVVARLKLAVAPIFGNLPMTDAQPQVGQVLMWNGTEIVWGDIEHPPAVWEVGNWDTPGAVWPP